MLSFFRRYLTSWVAVAILGLIMVAFIVTGIGTPGGGLTGAPGGDAVATVGGRPLGTSEVAGRLESELRQARQQQPDATMAQLLQASGGLDRLVDTFVTGRLLEVWAQKQGIAASERLIGGEIASIPAFQGPTGKFDQAQMQQLLNQQRMSYASLHDGIRDDLLRRQLLTPITAGARAPLGLTSPYAALLLDKREGSIGFVPASPAGLPAPAPAEVEAWYRGHIAGYSLPERRVLRYALLAPATATPPTDAEIAAAYKADAAKYGASETRTLSQVVLPDEAAARAKATASAILAKVRGGTPIAAAFAAAKQPAPQTTAMTQLDLVRAGQSGQPVPPALRTLFRLAPGKVDLAAAPGGGWFVVRLDRILPGDKAAIPALAAATRGELSRSLGEEYVEQFANAIRGDVTIRRNPAAIAELSRQLSGAAPAAQ